MSDWLAPVRAALDVARQPVPFFFRDDDAGWEDELLWDLLDRCQARKVHIDVAVIPAELDDVRAKALCDRASTGVVHLHQHGFRHVNHEPTGRKYEFGPSRSHDQQLADIAQGRALIGGLLHPYVDPIFTPPWNRCTDQTAAALVNLGFQVLSRDHTAVPFGIAELAEVPVTVDWFAKKKSEPWARQEIARQLAKQVLSGGAPVGVMLHHAITNEEHLGLVDELLALVEGHPKATSTSIYNSSF
jgi:peptidoglycan/xylan/chitin deacetylase (PgdA/CDA1 family)